MEVLYNSLLEIVCESCGVDKSIIFKTNKEEVVDARYILIYFLSLNLTDMEISKITGVSKSLANKIRNTFRYRLRKYSLNEKFKEINKKYGSIMM